MDVPKHFTFEQMMEMLMELREEYEIINKQHPRAPVFLARKELQLDLVRSTRLDV